MDKLVLHTALRVSLFQPFVIFIFIFMMNIMLERRRSLKYLILFVLFKTIVVNVILDFVFRETIDKSRLLYAIYVWIVIITLVCSFFIPYYTFSCEPVKIAIAVLASEGVITFCVYSTTAICNLIKSKRGGDFSGYIQPFELVIPVFVLLLFFIIYFFIKSYLYRFKEIEIMHKKIYWSVYGAFMFAGFMSMVRNPYMINKTDEIFLYLYQIMCMSIVFFVGVIIFLRYKRYVLRKHAFLKSEQKLMEAHYEALKIQIEQIQNYRQDIQEQMKMIEDVAIGELESERIAEYLLRLKKEYHSLKAGVYCNEWIIDAVLMQQYRVCESKGIDFTASMYDFSRGKIQERELVQLFIQLFEEVTTQAGNVTEDNRRKIFFHCTRRGNQLLIELKYGCIARKQHISLKVRHFLKEMDGEIKINRSGGFDVIVVMLQC